jgi:hypothetical protein
MAIGIDTLKVYLPNFRLKKGHRIDVMGDMVRPERNNLRLIYDDGESVPYRTAYYNTDGMGVNIKPTGGLTAQVSVPKIVRPDNIEPGGAGDVRKAYQFICDGLSDAGVSFNKAEMINSRIDVTAGYDVAFSPAEYFTLLGMLPYATKDYTIGSTKYAGNKSFMQCVYDKAMEYEEAHGCRPEGYEDRNNIRFETRLLKAAKLKSDARKVDGLDMRKVDTLTHKDSFARVMNGLHDNYVKRLFRQDYRTLIENERNGMIHQMKAQQAVGLKPREVLLLTSLAVKILSLDEIAQIFYPREVKHSKRYRYALKRSIEVLLDKASGACESGLVRYDAMYDELRRLVVNDRAAA